MINIIANRYAEALFEIGEEQNLDNEFYQDLKDILSTMKSCNELNKSLRSPLVTKDEKKNLLKAVLDENSNVCIKNFLFLLVDKDRVSYLNDISKEYKMLMNEKHNILEGEAVSAMPMTKKEIEDLQLKLSKKYNKNVVLTNVIDGTILGGVLVRLGNDEIDGTIKTRLTKLKDQLSQVIS